MTSPARRVLLPLALVLAVPASASAASVTFTADGGKARGYGVGASGAGKLAFATLVRGTGTSVQEYIVTASSHVRHTARANLSKATLKASLGRFGSLALTFRATAPAQLGQVSPVCHGKPPTMRKGVVTGLLKLRVDAHHFKTIRRTHMTGTLFRANGAVTCTGPAFTGFQPVVQLTSTARDAAKSTLTASELRNGKRQEIVSSIAHSGSVTLNRTISTTATAPVFTAASSLSAASLRGSGPFLGGKVTFAGHASTGTSVTGTLRGTFTAKFVADGKVTFRSGGRATLTRPTLVPR